MSLLNAVVVDANILVSISSKETKTHEIAEDAFNSFAVDGWQFFAPNVIVAESMFALCNKLETKIFSPKDHEKAVESFLDYMTVIETPRDESVLMKRAIELRQSYGCSRSSDGLYIALAEELSKLRTTEILTFDLGMKNQIEKNAQGIGLHLLLS